MKMKRKIISNTQSVLMKVRNASVMEILSMAKKVTPGQQFYPANTSLRKVLREQLHVITKLWEEIQLLELQSNVFAGVKLPMQQKKKRKRKKLNLSRSQQRTLLKLLKKK